MRVPRTYVDAALAPGREIALDGAAARHLGTVLRLRPGAALILFDGRGAEHDAELVEVGKTRGVARVGAARPALPESTLDLELVQGVARGERMDFAVQKAVELGVRRIRPVTTARSVVRLDERKAAKRHDHWRGVIIGACEQSGRAHVPQLAPVATLDDWFATGPHGGFVLDPLAEHGPAGLNAPAGPVSLLIGPEGGLTDDEIARARQAGLAGIRLGPRVLRTETAAIATLAALQTLWGDLAD